MSEIVEVTQWGVLALVASGALGMITLTLTGVLNNRSAAHNAETAQERMSELHSSSLQALTSARTVDTLTNGHSK